MELLQVLTLNLCVFDPGLESGSWLAIKSNLVIYLVPYFFLGFLMYWKKALEFDLWYGFKHIYPPHRIFFATQKTKTNQTHNVKDLMVVEFFSNDVYKIQPTFWVHTLIYYIEEINMIYYDKISKMSTTFLRKHFVLFSFFCIFEIINFMLALHFGGENLNHQYFS